MGEQEKKPVSMWAIVEIFGHQRVAGLLTECTVAGHGFVRIDVPEITDVDGSAISAHSVLYGPAAIYAINPTDESLARVAARSIRHAPVGSYGLADALRAMPDEHRTRLLGAVREGTSDSLP